MNSNRYLYRQLPYLLLIPILLVSFLPGPVLLGTWESVTYYHTFGAVEAPLSFIIASRANIGGQGYALLEMARTIILHLHLPLNLFTFRIPSLVFGIISLLLFFKICKRWFGPWPALGATALLAVNQVFFQFEHMMTVLVISGAALLFIIERLQVLDVRYWDVKAWIGFALSIAFVSLHYGPARIFAVALIGLWLGKVYWQLKGMPNGKTMRHGIGTLGGYSAAATLLLLTLLDFRNLFSILRLPSFLFPPKSDIAVLQYSSQRAGGVTFAETLKTNLTIFIDSISSHIGNYHSPYSSYLFADFRYPLLDQLVLPFVIFGLTVSVFRIRRKTTIFAMPWGSILTVLTVCALPLFFSVVTVNPNGLIATLSGYRMYFCLFPLYLLIAAFLHWLGASSISKRVVQYGVALCLTVIFIRLTINLTQEHARFQTQVFAPTWQKHGSEIKEIWDDHMPNLDRRGYNFGTHFQQHAQYANVAKQIADKLKTQDKNLTNGTRRIVFVDVNKFSEAPITPLGLDYITNRNYHSIFLALYAGQEGVNLNPVVMVDSERRPIAPYLMSGLAYKGKPREYSALTELDKNGLLTYKRDVDIIPVIVELTGASSYDILVTTPEEEAGARQLLEKKYIPFEYVKI